MHRDHTYRFQGGSCQAPGDGVITLTVGTTVGTDRRHNAGAAGFVISVSHRFGSTVGAWSKSRDLTGPSGEIRFSGRASGTFASVKGATSSFHGAWNCHGSLG